jgi:endonuclease/exonuclease/phosphatase family metal-dependent hydrolase
MRLLLLSALALSACSPPEPGEDEAMIEESLGSNEVARRYRVLHWNVAGGKIHKGRTNTGLIRALRSAVQELDPHFIGLNELCRSQFEALKRGLIADRWPDDPEKFARFVESRTPRLTPGKCGGAGVAIFSKKAIRAAERFELPSDGSVDHRWLICAPLVDLDHMRFCSTHLTPRLRDGHNRKQLRKLFGHLERYHRHGDTVLLTGDLNTEPDAESMNAVYAPGVDTPHNRNNSGEYRELDDSDASQCRGYGEATGLRGGGGGCGDGRKIDYLFVRRDRVERDGDPQVDYGADSRPLNHACSASGTDLCSDHRMLTGRVTVRVQRN